MVVHRHAVLFACHRARRVHGGGKGQQRKGRKGLIAQLFFSFLGEGEFRWPHSRSGKERLFWFCCGQVPFCIHAVVRAWNLTPPTHNIAFPLRQPWLSLPPTCYPLTCCNRAVVGWGVVESLEWSRILTDIYCKGLYDTRTPCLYFFDYHFKMSPSHIWDRVRLAPSIIDAECLAISYMHMTDGIYS
jgi:hypothetical protein